MPHIVFDIETAPLSEAEVVARLGAFDEAAYIAAKHPGEFAAERVACGNLKDPDKIAAKIDDARAAHAQRVKDFQASLPWAAAEHNAALMEKAALSAITGRFIAIGIVAGDDDIETHFAHEYSEKCGPDAVEATMLRHFWSVFDAVYENQEHLIGVNIFRFDLPFLVQRSWLLGVPVPKAVLDRGRYWSDVFVDLVSLWNCGQPNGYTSLDQLAKAFGLPGKPEGECDGASFWKFASSDDPEQVALARHYLTEDVRQPLCIARRMGFEF